jgi:nicotinate-nucleotide adenylyltransferase
MTIGIFGGSFNPPHYGHLIVLEAVADQLQLDRILFIPSAQPPNKRDVALAGAFERLEMTRLAVGGNPHFDVSDIEIRRTGLSYTIDTINSLTEMHRGAKLLLVIGMDNFMEFDTWKCADEIIAKADLVVMNRPGYNTPSSQHGYGKIARFVNVPQIAISSTDIRRRVKLGRSIRYLVPEAVQAYINSRRLYRE